jgi:transcriptional regulator with XRE-family HTH domain
LADLLYLYFGINLRSFRRNRGFSQSRLGRRTDPPLSQEAISRYERGLQPLERHVQSLADALGVPPEALLRRPRIVRADGLQAVVIQHPLPTPVDRGRR